MLKISPERTTLEATRAAEQQAADAALERERLLWWIAAVTCVFIGAVIAAGGLHAQGETAAAIWIVSGVLFAEIGPLLILLIAVKREVL